MGLTCTITVPVEKIDTLRALLSEEQILSDLSKITRKVAMIVLRGLVYGCSVDTGRARAGFLALFSKYGFVPNDVLDRPSPYQGERQTPQKGRDAAAQAEGLSAGQVMADLPLRVVVANGVNYVELINSGTSKMEGTGFIDKTFQRAYDYLPRVADWYVDERLKSVGFRPEINPMEGPGDL